MADRIPPRPKTYQAVSRLRQGHERGLGASMQRLLRRQAERVGDVYRRGGPPAVVTLLETDYEKARTVLQAHQAESAKRMIALRTAVMLQRKPESVEELVLSLLGQIGFEHSKSITQTTIGLAQAYITRQVAEGVGVGEVAKGLGGFLNSNATHRASMIARTEIGVATSLADETTMDHSGLDYKAVWLTANDGGERHPSAPGLEGQVREQGEPFDVRGAQMLRPLDPSGPASEVINCRCVKDYQVQ